MKTKSCAENYQVFSRLHNKYPAHKQELRKKSSKRIQKKDEYPTKTYTLNDEKNVKRKTEKLKSSKSSKQLMFDANIGHRLYVKSRGQSIKREKSLRSRRQSQRENEQKEQVNKKSLISEGSKWILQEKSFRDFNSSSSTWNRKNLLNDMTYAEKSVNEYKKKKQYEQEVLCTFKPKITKNSQLLANRKSQVSFQIKFICK